MKMKNILCGFLALTAMQTTVMCMFSSFDISQYNEFKEAVFEKLKETNPSFAEKFETRFSEPSTLSVLVLAQHIDKYENRDETLSVDGFIGNKCISFAQEIGDLMYNYALDDSESTYTEQDIKSYNLLVDAAREKEGEMYLGPTNYSSTSKEKLAVTILASLLSDTLDEAKGSDGLLCFKIGDREILLDGETIGAQICHHIGKALGM